MNNNKIKYGAYLTGSFGQSQKLYELRNEEKRGNGSKKSVEEQVVKDTKKIISLQEKAGLDFIVDPMFNQFYLFQPLSENVGEVDVGPQENWFNNNVFYWRPQINGPLSGEVGFTKNNLHLDLFDKENLLEKSMVILPSPFTLLSLSDVKGYVNKKDAIKDISQFLKKEANELTSLGVARIQFDEPVIVYKQSLGSLTKEDKNLLSLAMGICGENTNLHTYFGDAGNLVSYLANLPVKCIGIDCTQTSLNDILKYDLSDKELALGLVDSRNISLEDPNLLAEKLVKVSERCNPKKIYLTTNTGTQYRGWTHGLNKLDVIEKTMRLLE